MSVPDVMSDGDWIDNALLGYRLSGARTSDAVGDKGHADASMIRGSWRFIASFVQKRKRALRNGTLAGRFFPRWPSQGFLCGGTHVHPFAPL